MSIKSVLTAGLSARNHVIFEKEGGAVGTTVTLFLLWVHIYLDFLKPII